MAKALMAKAPIAKVPMAHAPIATTPMEAARSARLRRTIPVGSEAGRLNSFSLIGALFLYGGDSDGVVGYGAVNCDLLTGIVGHLGGVGELVDLGADDEDGVGAALDAFLGAGGVVGACGFGGVLG